MRRSFNGKHAMHAGLAAALLVGAGGANASLVLLGDIDLTGTGLGAVPTVLTLNSTANTTTELGSVAWNGTADVTTGNTQAITQTQTIASAGATAASNLRIVFNANEGGTAANNPITLNSLVMTIYSPTGTSLFTANLLPAGTAETPISLTSTLTGIGRAGYVFGLNAEEAAAAQTTAFAGAFQNNRIGLSASLSNVNTGPETFFVGNQGGAGGGGGLPPLVGPIPEPGTMAMLATGLLAMGGIARRRRQS
jgi:hypothetical protein